MIQEMASTSSRARAPKAKTRAIPDRLLNRELSWLEFNGRVLELAADASVPLLERVKFCSIFSANLDEFFMVRVGGLIGREESGIADPTSDGRTPVETLAAIRERVVELGAEQSRVWSKELRPSLASEGIEIGQVDDCDAAELEELTRRFEAEVYPGADAARSRSRAAVPVHLRALAQSRRLRAPARDRGGALRARQGSRGPRRGSSSSASAACGSRSRTSSRTTSPTSSRRWRSSSAPRSG